jgi:acyl-CoA synthetase (AMP-forming)/AMP-acid ligase II
VTSDELIAHCRDPLAVYKSPREVLILDSMPKTRRARFSGASCAAREELRGGSQTAREILVLRAPAVPL